MLVLPDTSPFCRLVLWLCSSSACCCLLQCHVCAFLMTFSPWPWCMHKPATRVSTDTDTAYSFLAYLGGGWRDKVFLYTWHSDSSLQYVVFHLRKPPDVISCHVTQRTTNYCQNWGLSSVLSCFTQVNIGARQSIRNCIVKCLDCRNISEFPGHSAYLVCIPYQTELFQSAEKWNLW